MKAPQKRIPALAACQHGQSSLEFLHLEASDTGTACDKFSKARRVVAHKLGFRTLAACSRGEGGDLLGQPGPDAF